MDLVRMFEMVYPPRNAPQEVIHQWWTRVAVVSCAGFCLSVGGWVFSHRTYATNEQLLAFMQEETRAVQDLGKREDGAIAQLAAADSDRWGFSLRQDLLQLDQERCRLSPGPLRDQYDAEIEEGKLRYLKITGLQYDPPACNGL